MLSRCFILILTDWESTFEMVKSIHVWVWQKLKLCSFSQWQMHREIHLQQMPGHSHKLLILSQHFRLSDFDCHLFQTKDFKARHKCLLNFIWLISLKSIFVTSKDSTCCSPRQNYSELIWRRNEACWISTTRL